MATYLEALKGVNAYPVPLRTLTGISERHGVVLTDEATRDGMTGKAYNLCVAEVLLWLSFAPDVTQGGQSYSFTDEQRTQLRNRANALFNEFGDEDDAALNKPLYGYKGSRL